MNEITPPFAQETGALLDSLVRAGQMIEQRMDAAMQPYGLSIAKMSALHVLIRAEEPTALGVLSQQLHCVRSNITQLIDRLEADKLVQRIPDAEDRRSVRAAITEEGRQRYQAGWQAMENAKQEVLGGLSPADQEQLWNLLARLLGGQGH